MRRAPLPQLRKSLRWHDLLVLNPHRQNPDLRSDALLAKLLKQQPAGLPYLKGSPVLIEVRPGLSAHRGRLLSGETRGTPVYAASFIRKRWMVLDHSLLQTPEVLYGVLIHELFHFAWVRLSNVRRGGFADLIAHEKQAGARGEAGESAEVHKGWVSGTAVEVDSRKWRNYVCESFCDTAALLFGDPAQRRQSPLAERWLDRRRQWFAKAAPGGWLF